MFELRENGTLVFKDGDDSDAVVVGEAEGDRLTLDLGWLRQAGAFITVRDDPQGPHHRRGITLETE